MQENVYLVIGIGNVLRRDDGAGLVLAEAVRSALDERGQATQLRQVQQLFPELAEEIGEIRPHTVLLADCRADDGKDVVQAIRLQRIELADAGSTVSGSHGLTPTHVLALARRLYGYTGEAWLATAPGFDFGHGEGLSSTTRHAIECLTPAIIERII